MGKRVLRLRSATLGTNGGVSFTVYHGIVRVALTILLRDLGEKTFYGG